MKGSCSECHFSMSEERYNKDRMLPETFYWCHRYPPHWIEGRPSHMPVGQDDVCGEYKDADKS